MILPLKNECGLYLAMGINFLILNTVHEVDIEYTLTILQTLN